MQGCGRPAASAALGLCPRGAAGCGPAAPGTLPFGPSPPRLAHLTCVRWPCLARLPAAGLTVSPQAAGPASAHCCLWLERCKAAWGLSTSFSTIMLTGAMCGADSSPVPPLPVQTARQACCHGRAPTPSVPRRACGPAEPWDGPGPPLPFCCAHCHCQGHRALPAAPARAPRGAPSPEPGAHQHPDRQRSGSPPAGPPACHQSPPVPPAGGEWTRSRPAQEAVAGALFRGGGGHSWGRELGSPLAGSGQLQCVAWGTPPRPAGTQGPEQTPQPSLQRLASTVLLPTVYSDPEQVTRDMQAPWAHGSLTCIATLTLGSSQGTAPWLPGQGWAQ